jgi:ATP-dependent Clp protease ATP-binding subunit ClpA
VWERLSAPAAAVMRLAGEEAGRLGQDYVGDEHVLLGLLRYGVGPAAALLAEAGATLAGARAELASMRARGLTLGPHPGSPQALQMLGIDAEQVRQRLTSMFGADAPPRPAYWMQQLTRASEPDGAGAWLNGRTFAAHVRGTLKTEHPRG